MKHYFKLSSIVTIFFTISLCSASPVASRDASAHAAAPSVHEIFKDVPQDELLMMMEEGQQFIKYLEEHGTAEEKMAFQQAMEETLQSFTDEDWAEFEAIVDTVQDKLLPLETEPQEKTAVQVEPVKVEPKKEESVVTIDNSLEKVLHAIHKAINTLLLKAKSDIVLTERITIGWENKDKLNEMARLLQTLNKKDHLAKLTTSKDEAIVALLESIQNFNKRLQIENDQFIIADTFGLQADEQTTAINLKKLNKILEFFDNAIESLLPKLIKFVEEYEPEALKQAKEHDDDAKKALENATKVEKYKRPAGSMGYHDRSPSNGSKKNNKQLSQAGYNHHASGAQGHTTEQVPGYLELVHKENLKNIPQSKKHSDNKNGTPAGKDDDKKKEIKKDTEYEAAIEALENYLTVNGNVEVNNYMKTVSKAEGIYAAFDTPISEADTNRFGKLQEKRSISASLESDEVRFLKNYEEKWQKANDSFAKNTQAAHTLYSNLADSITNIAPQIDEMSDVIQAVKASLNSMNSKDLEKLQNSTTLKNFSQRINNYHTTFKKAQSELKNKHKINKIHRTTPQYYSQEERDYDDLAAKVDSMHGLDKKIAEVKSKLDGLHKSIKSTIASKKRAENKQAAAQ